MKRRQKFSEEENQQIYNYFKEFLFVELNEVMRDLNLSLETISKYLKGGDLSSYMSPKKFHIRVGITE